MDGMLRYIGQVPTYSFKLEWMPGQAISLNTFKEHVVKSVKKSVNSEADFLSWLDVAVAGKDFLVENSHSSYEDETMDSVETSIDTTDVLPVETTKKGRGRPRKNTVLVESSEVKVSKSLASARQKLKDMHHPDEIGLSEKSESKGINSNRLPSEVAKDLEKSESKVITGDSLKMSSSIATDSDKRRGQALMLDQSASVVTRIASSKEEQAVENAKLANLSGRIKVLQTEPGKDDSYIVDGGDKDLALSSKNDNQHSPGKVNKYLQTQGGHSGLEKTISVEDFISQKDETEVSRLIKLCKDPITLKMAKIYYRDNGIHRVVDKIEERLRTIVKY